MNCRTARVSLQAPEQLELIESCRLDRHLEECEQCTTYHRRQLDTDQLIRRSMNAVATPSVRERVHLQLLARDALQARARIQKPPPQPIRRWTRKFGIAPLGLLLAPTVAVMVALLIYVGEAVSGHGRYVTPSVAGWHEVRPNIGYPVAADPNRPGHLLAGSWHQVYESWNYGDSWHRLASIPAGLRVRDVAFDATQPNHYLVATLHEVLLSTDAGRHWTTAAKGLLGAENMFLFQPPHDSAFYVGPSVLWKSSDHGATWQRDGSGKVFAPYGIQSLTSGPNHMLITSIWGGGVAVSRDGGVTWHHRSRGLALGTMDVAAAPGGKMWAATSEGLFRTVDSGARWVRSPSAGHFFATSIVNAGSYLLAGGNGGVYRSTDGGKTWVAATNGLPLAPYIYGFTLDQRHHQRVYASLDSDGVFRSDDGGLHWQAVDAGLPLTGSENAATHVLFLRGGHLWSTDDSGTDPGSLTVDGAVSAASISPDGQAVAYVAGTPGGWMLRVISTGGSAATTLNTGTGIPPRRIFWSPTASKLAIAQAGDLRVVNLNGRDWQWRVTPMSTLLGWTGDGRALRVWDEANQRVVRLAALTGGYAGREPGLYPSAPLASPNGTVVARLEGNRVLLSSWLAPKHDVSIPAGSCQMSSWSGDGSRLLLICRSTFVEISSHNHVVLSGPLLGTPAWVPGSDSGLLFFRHGSLLRWSSGSSARLIVRNARPVASD